MFFDEHDPRKNSARARQRPAHDSAAEDVSWLDAALGPVDAPAALSARDRHRAARVEREPKAPSLLDQIDDISRRTAEARAQSERQRAEDERRLAGLRQLERAAAAAQVRYADEQPALAEEPLAPPRPPAAEVRIPHVAYQPQQTRAEPAQPQFDSGAPLIDPRFVFRAVRQWRYAIALTTLLGAGAGALTAMTTPKLYYSVATVMVDPRNNKVLENDLTPDVFLSESALAIIDSQASLMRSPRVLEKVVADLGLANDAEFNGSRQHGLLSFFGILSGQPADDFSLASSKYLLEHTGVDRAPKTFNVSVAAFTEDSQKSALIANKLVEVFLAEQQNNRSDTAKRASGELGSRLDELKAAVEKSERAVEGFKAENNLVDTQGRLISDEEILRVNDQLAAARATTISLKSRAQSLKAATVDQVVQAGLPEEVASSALTALRSQYVAAEQRKDGLAAKLGPMHPDLQQASTEVESLRGAVNGEISRIRAAIQTDLTRAVETEKSLSARMAQLKAGQAGTGDAQVRLRELEREAASARTVYEQYLLRARETGEQGAVNSSNVQVISEAKPADKPEGASRKLVMIGGMIAGFIAGFGLAVLKGMFDALRHRFAGGGDRDQGAGFASDAPAPTQPSPPDSGRRRFAQAASALSSAFTAPAGQPAAMAGSRESLAQAHAMQQPAQGWQAQIMQQPEQGWQPPALPQPVPASQPASMPPQMPVQQVAYIMPTAVQTAPAAPQMAAPAHYLPYAPAQQFMPAPPQPQFVLQPVPQFSPAPTAPVFVVSQPLPQVQPHDFASAAAQQPRPAQYGQPQPVQPTLADIQDSLQSLRADLQDIAWRRRRA